MSAIPCTPWQAGFLTVLPSVQAHAKNRFSRLRAERRHDAIQEAIASACVSYQLLAAKGRLHVAHPTTLAGYAVKHVRAGRHVGGSQSSRDVLSPLAQRRRGFSVDSLSQTQDYYGLRPLITDRRHYSPADAAAFRVDFAAWLNSHPRRDRRIIARLSSGERTADVARRFGLSEPRISQLRRRFERSWHVFQGEMDGQP